MVLYDKDKIIRIWTKNVNAMLEMIYLSNKINGGGNSKPFNFEKIERYFEDDEIVIPFVVSEKTTNKEYIKQCKDAFEKFLNKNGLKIKISDLDESSNFETVEYLVDPELQFNDLAMIIDTDPTSYKMSSFMKRLLISSQADIKSKANLLDKLVRLDSPCVICIKDELKNTELHKYYQENKVEKLFYDFCISTGNLFDIAIIDWLAANEIFDFGGIDTKCNYSAPLEFYVHGGSVKSALNMLTGEEYSKKKDEEKKAVLLQMLEVHEVYTNINNMVKLLSMNVDYSKYFIYKIAFNLREYSYEIVKELSKNGISYEEYIDAIVKVFEDKAEKENFAPEKAELLEAANGFREITDYKAQLEASKEKMNSVKLRMIDYKKQLEAARLNLTNVLKVANEKVQDSIPGIKMMIKDINSNK